MSVPKNILRIVLLAAAAGLLAVAASVLREKKEIVNLTTEQIEDAILGAGPGHLCSRHRPTDGRRGTAGQRPRRPLTPISGLALVSNRGLPR
jgi:hypothetical protein